MIRGEGLVVGLFCCRFWIPPVLYEVLWRWIWESVYDNAAVLEKLCGLPSIQDHMVPVPHWTRLIMIIACDMLKLYMRVYDY